MADRRDESSPLAPHRSLGGPAKSDESAQSEPRRPLSERVSAAIAATGGSRSAESSHAAERPAHAGRPTSGIPRVADRPSRPPAPRPAAPARAPRTRRARLRLTRLDPWSVMKTSFLLSIAFGIVSVIAVAVVWSVLGAAGVWDSINATVAEVIGGDTGSEFDIENYLGTSRVLGFTMLVAVVDVVLITAIATLAAFLYNLSAALLGGVEVTLAEDDH